MEETGERNMVQAVSFARKLPFSTDTSPRVHRRYKRYSKLKEPSKKRERCAEQLQDMGDPLPDPRTKKIKIEKC